MINRREMMAVLGALPLGFETKLMPYRPDERAVIVVTIDEKKFGSMKPWQLKHAESAIRLRLKKAGCDLPVVCLPNGIEVEKVHPWSSFRRSST